MAYLKVLSPLSIVHFPCITRFYLSPMKCTWIFFFCKNYFTIESGYDSTLCTVTQLSVTAHSNIIMCYCTFVSVL